MLDTRTLRVGDRIHADVDRYNAEVVRTDHNGVKVRLLEDYHGLGAGYEWYVSHTNAPWTVVPNNSVEAIFVEG